jgi:DNA invertase Pin-like site-specific DNA recombinase
MSELSAEAINEIVHRRALGQSIRGIARSMHLSRRAVGRAFAKQDSKVRRTLTFPGDAVSGGA